MRTALACLAGLLAWGCASQPHSEHPARETPAASGSALDLDRLLSGPPLTGSAPSAPSWAPDGSRLAFRWQDPDDARREIWLVGADGTDLRQVPFRRGQGYDVAGLTQVLTAHDWLARRVLQRLIEHAGDLREVSALGFCVSVDHARFMARVFQEQGVAAQAVWGDTPAAEREAALAALRDGALTVLFSVDLFNEGVDVPSLNTLLLLRPTESATLFLQQLGRGLRKVRGKASCLVLDFIGHHRAEFRFDQRLSGLLPGGRKAVLQAVEC